MHPYHSRRDACRWSGGRAGRFNSSSGACASGPAVEAREKKGRHSAALCLPACTLRYPIPSMAAGPVNKTREFEDDARAPPRTSAVATVREAMRLEGRTDGNAVGGTVRRSERAVTIGRPDPRWWLVPCFVCRLDFGSCAVLPWGSF
jgi:hypothetical protein